MSLFTPGLYNKLDVVNTRAPAMDFKYKHFHQQRLYPGTPQEVFDSARAVMAESVGWTIAQETLEGFTAQGTSFGHVGIANIQIHPTGGGNVVDIELRVERAGFTGFMLFDVGGYYNIQIRKWLDAIQMSLHQQATGQRPPTPAPLQSQNKAAARVFHGCLLLIAIGFALYLLATVIEAVVGLATGNLFLVGRGGTITVHGPAARAISIAILGFGGWIVWRIIRKPHKPSIIQ
jgi:uncharacterized membrane protein (Fun14 family)